MATVDSASENQHWLRRFFTTDFCPGANRYVYWLKEPIGWFVLATAASVLVGIYANTIGWTIAGALLAIIVVGMVWPLIAVLTTVCELRPEDSAVHEGISCRMILTVQNRLPLPVWGLMVEGYLDCEGDDSLPSVSLSQVPPICVADYGVAVRPELRGHYPIQTPKIACSFPFGIWTARRELRAVQPLTVWPRVYEIAGLFPLSGQVNAELGDGSRGGRSGDYVGVREFRRGDSPRHINWAKSARTETLIVTERGGPQSVEVDLHVDSTIARGHSRQTLAIRIRVAASILCNLHGCNVPKQVSIGDRFIPHAAGHLGRRQLLDALAEVPADGRDATRSAGVRAKTISIEVTGGEPDEGHDVVLVVRDPLAALRTGGNTKRIGIDSSQSLGGTNVSPLAGAWTCPSCRLVP